MLTRAEIPGLICTALLVLVGLFLVRWHWRSWKRIENDPEQATLTRWFQSRRRMQVAGLIVFEGLLLCVGDAILPILQRADWITPRQLAAMWGIDMLAILLVAIWLVLLAMGDLAVAVAQARLERLRAGQQERSLCEEIERFRDLHGDPET